MIENANKLTYLRKLYPELSSEDLLKLLQVSDLDKNVAIWLAEELGFITVDDGEITLNQAPETWALGKDIKSLQDTIVYCFKQLAKRETDLDEHFLVDWLIGYPSQNSLLAVQQLVDDRVLFEYNLTDESAKTGLSVYRFYTLYENSEMQWGKKNFAKAPKSEGKR
jgi:hypothetical protein